MVNLIHQRNYKCNIFLHNWQGQPIKDNLFIFVIGVLSHFSAGSYFYSSETDLNKLVCFSWIVINKLFPFQYFWCAICYSCFINRSPPPPSLFPFPIKSVVMIRNAIREIGSHQDIKTRDISTKLLRYFPNSENLHVFQ